MGIESAFTLSTYMIMTKVKDTHRFFEMDRQPLLQYDNQTLFDSAFQWRSITPFILRKEYLHCGDLYQGSTKT